MSLLGNRGRFSSDNEKLNSVNNSFEKSELSSIGKNPTNFFKFKKEEKSDKTDIKERLLIASKNINEEKKSSHLKYNNSLSKKEKPYIKEKNTNTEIEHKKKKKFNIKTLILMVIVEILTIIFIINVSPFLRMTQLTQDIPFDTKSVIPTYIDESTVNIMKGYKTVAVFGVDSRNGSVAKGANADVNLIINLNVETGEVKLVSLYRDLYLSVTDGNTYDKLNSAYRRGGPEGAVKAINKNLDLHIANYFAFNWKAVADGISLLGGVDLEINKAEYKYMNAFIHETCIATGIDAKNPAAHYIKSTGMQHLDGVQAVAYGRLRLMDSDFQRVDRQKKIISLCLEKAKSLDLNTLKTIIEAVLPQIAYEFDLNEIISLLRLVNSVTITDSTACPELSNLVSMDMGPCGTCVVPINLEKAVSILHNILFNEEDYKVSDAVRRYSNRIVEMRHKYQEENRLREESEAISNSISTASTVTNNVSKKVNTASNSNMQSRIASASVMPVIGESPIGNEDRQNNNETSENEVEVKIGVSPSDDISRESDENTNTTNNNTNTGPGDNNINPTVEARPENFIDGPNGNKSNANSPIAIPDGPPGSSSNDEQTLNNNNIPTNIDNTANSGPTNTSEDITEPSIVIP